MEPELVFSANDYKFTQKAEYSKNISVLLGHT